MIVSLAGATRVATSAVRRLNTAAAMFMVIAAQIRIATNRLGEDHSHCRFRPRRTGFGMMTTTPSERVPSDRGNRERSDQNAKHGENTNSGMWDRNEVAAKPAKAVVKSTCCFVDEADSGHKCTAASGPSGYRAPNPILARLPAGIVSASRGSVHNESWSPRCEDLALFTGLQSTILIASCHDPDVVVADFALQIVEDRSELLASHAFNRLFDTLGQSGRNPPRRIDDPFVA